ncbi:MAG: hybrid sensor histidine kinase/response regulator [Candidatus Tectomicrobia bacterium]|uniref:histidine kinase n=1 Tax=Tectimicrobiota bacterium TaxID=2528274 RepID=A0A937VXL7_UNCTE|nr:hybrid sensor histidine kinase/response regulator [Candidatus Tectomicrobia bacterium]
MLQLFRTEVETQVALLNDGLLALEREPHTTTGLTTLMRAAHSIKGAARVVHLAAAEQVAHALEDCFVAAQSGTVHFTGKHIEGLLRGVDMLLRLAPASQPGETPAQAPQSAEIEALLSTLAEIVTPTVAPSPPVLPPPVTLEPSRFPEPGSKDRVLRVTAEHLHQLLGLAGESLVASRWLPPYIESLRHVKKSQMALSEMLDTLWDSLQGLPLPAHVATYMQAAQRQVTACRQTLAERLSELELFGHRADTLADRLYRAALASHMRPFEDGVQGFPRMVRDLARQLDKQVQLEILGRVTAVDRDILERLEAPLSHLLRNAVVHGIETPAERLAAGKVATGTIRLEARHQDGMLAISVTDDGCGADVAQLRQRIVTQQLASAEVAQALSDAEVIEFLFLPAFSTATMVTELAGRGVGLDVVRSMAQTVGGSVHTRTVPGQGMGFYLQLPLTLSVVRALLAEIGGEPYAFPLARLDRVLLVPHTDVAVYEDSQYVTVDDEPVRLVAAHEVLDVQPGSTQEETLAIIVLSDRYDRYGLVVERFLDETDLVVHPLDARLGKIPDISAAALLEDGSPVLIIDVEDMVRSAATLLSGRPWRMQRAAVQATASSRKRVLVVDDSLTVRTGQRQLLEQQGYAVEVAGDGMEGWNAVRLGHYDLVITDVDMPRLDGFELVRRIKHDVHLQHLPVILVSYKGRPEDRQRGIAVGAQAYFSKSDVHEPVFLQTVMALVAKP